MLLVNGQHCARSKQIRDACILFVQVINNATQFISYVWDMVVKCWTGCYNKRFIHYDDVIMTMLASQITSLPVVCSIVYSDVNQRKHQSSASLAFVREIHRGPVNFPHKWPVTRKMFPFDDVIMTSPMVTSDTASFTTLWLRYCSTAGSI